MQWYRGLVGSNGARGLGRLSRSGWTLLTVKLSLVCSVGSNIVGAFRRPAPHCPVTIDRVRHHAALALAALRETPRPPASAPGSATRPPYHPPSIIYVAHAKVYRMMKAEMTRLGASGAELQAVLHHATVDVNAIVAMNPSGWAYDPVPNSTIMPFGRNDNEAAQMLSHKRSGRNPPPSHNARLDKGRQTQLLKRWNGRSVAPDSNFFLAQKYQTKQAPLPHNKALMEFWTKHAVLIHLGPQVASELQHHVLHHNANPWWRAPQYAGVLVTLAGANLASVRNAHYGRPAGARPVRPKDPDIVNQVVHLCPPGTVFVTGDSNAYLLALQFGAAGGTAGGAMRGATAGVTAAALRSVRRWQACRPTWQKNVQAESVRSPYSGHGVRLAPAVTHPPRLQHVPPERGVEIYQQRETPSLP